MDFSKVSKYLYNDPIGKLPTDSSGQPCPALLFNNSKNSDNFGDIYLFSNFGISGANTITANSDITIHYTEDNLARSDHWALPPVTYILTGFIGEVIYRPSETWTNWLQDKVVDYLDPLNIISPTVSGYVSSAMNVVHELEATYQKYSKYAENIIRTVNNWNPKNISTDLTNQAEIYQDLKLLRENRILVDVYTPYETLKDMAILNISMTEVENSKYKSSITITLQEYRDFATKTRQATKNEVASLAQTQQAEEVNKGNAKTKKGELKSLIYKGVTGEIEWGNILGF